MISDISICRICIDMLVPWRVTMMLYLKWFSNLLVFWVLLYYTSPETSKSSENQWLEDDLFPFRMRYFKGLCIWLQRCFIGFNTSREHDTNWRQEMGSTPRVTSEAVGKAEDTVWWNRVDTLVTCLWTSSLNLQTMPSSSIIHRSSSWTPAAPRHFVQDLVKPRADGHPFKVFPWNSCGIGSRWHVV